MGPIGIFDSGYGGLTVFREIEKILPEYDFLYLGDNARAPYGTRDFDTVYQYTLECVEQLFEMNCRLVVLACNTASAKALRSIQQNDLPSRRSLHRVLGVIRPTTEIIGNLTNTGSVGILATQGTVSSKSYLIESKTFFPAIKVYQQACPMWVPLVENNEHLNEGADYFVRKYITRLLDQSGDIDLMVLACTHYPLLLPKIQQFTPPHIKILLQGEIVAERLKDYLLRHPEIDSLCSKNGKREFYTTASTEAFDINAGKFLERNVISKSFSIR